MASLGPHLIGKGAVATVHYKPSAKAASLVSATGLTRPSKKKNHLNAQTQSNGSNIHSHRSSSSTSSSIASSSHHHSQHPYNMAPTSLVGHPTYAPYIPTQKSFSPPVVTSSPSSNLLIDPHGTSFGYSVGPKSFDAKSLHSPPKHISTNYKHNYYHHNTPSQASFIPTPSSSNSPYHHNHYHKTSTANISGLSNKEANQLHQGTTHQQSGNNGSTTALHNIGDLSSNHTSSHSIPPLPTTPEVGMVIEFSYIDGSFRLGIVASVLPEQSQLQVEFLESSGSPGTLSVSLSQVTFCWPLHYKSVSYHFDVMDLEAIQEQVQIEMEKRRSNLQVAYGLWMESAKIPIVTVESTAAHLFGGKARLHELYVAHRLLQESVACFDPVSPHPSPANSPTSSLLEKTKLQECFIATNYTMKPIESMRSWNVAARSALDKKLFLHRLARKMWSLYPSGRSLEDMVANLPPLTSTEMRLNVAWNPGKDAQFINQLKEYAFLNSRESASNSPVVTNFLQPLGIEQTPEGVFRLLVDLKVVTKYENPHAARFPHKLDFTSSELKQHHAQHNNVMSMDRDAQYRRDYRGFGPIFAIDSRLESAEIDDAIAIHRMADGTTWAHVHIADPTRCVAPNDSIDMLARSRVQSVFLPEKIATMFPPNFSRHCFSLLPGKVNYALTFAVQLNASNGQIERYEITPSIVDRITALTYDQADQIMIGASFQDHTVLASTPASHIQSLNALNDMAELRRKARERAGAVFIDVPRPDVEVSSNGESIDITPVRDSESPARRLVSEFMILVGEVTAMFATANSIPIPFRTQARRPEKQQSNHSLNNSNGNNSLVHSSQVQQPLFEPYSSPIKSKSSSIDDSYHPITDQAHTRLYPAYTDVQAKEHAGLGLPAYCQATSPIRRYTDLLVHYQIKSFLRGEPLPFSAPKLSAIISQLENVQTQLSHLTLDSARYWILRFLERQDPMKRYEGLVSGEQPSLLGNGTLQTMVWLVELGWKTAVNFAPGRSPSRGEKIGVMLSHVDAFNDDIEMEESTFSPLLKLSPIPVPNFSL